MEINFALCHKFQEYKQRSVKRCIPAACFRLAYVKSSKWILMKINESYLFNSWCCLWFLQMHYLMKFLQQRRKKMNASYLWTQIFPLLHPSTGRHCIIYSIFSTHSNKYFDSCKKVDLHKYIRTIKVTAFVEYLMWNILDPSRWNSSGVRLRKE